MITAHHNVFGQMVNSTPLLLDLFPADFALSLFKIRTAYTGYCLRVLRDSDNTTLNIGFVGGVLDTATMLSFVGSANGYVNRWYSQAGVAGNFAFNGTPSTSPKIVNAGSLLTLNGHPSVYLDGVDDIMFLDLDEVVTNDFSMFSYGKRDASGNLFTPLSNPTPGATLMQFTDNNYYFVGLNGYDVSTSPDASSSAMLLEGHSTISNRDIYKNQSLITTSSVGGSFQDHFNRIGVYGGQFMKGYLNEVILYKTNQITNRVAIGNDIITRNS